MRQVCSLCVESIASESSPFRFYHFKPRPNRRIRQNRRVRIVKPIRKYQTNPWYVGWVQDRSDLRMGGIMRVEEG